MIGIDQYAYQSKISAVRAEDKFIFSVFPLLLCLVADSYFISLAVIVTMSICTIHFTNLKMIKYLKLLTIPLTFLILGTLTIIINRVEDTNIPVLIAVPLFGNVYGVTLQSLSFGIKLILKSLGAVSCLYFFSLNTSMNSFFNYLRRSKLPIIIVELAELIYRFIFVIWSEANKIHTAQESRLGYKGFINSFKSLGVLVSNTFIKSFNRIDKMHQALESRGFDGRFEYLLTEEKKSKGLRNSGLIFAVILICILLLEKVIT